MKTLLLLILTLSSFSYAEKMPDADRFNILKHSMISCKVTGIDNGNEFSCIDKNHKKIKVKLFGVNTPKITQPYGKEAKQALSNWILGNHVYIESIGHHNNRTLGIVEVVALSCSGECLFPDGSINFCTAHHDINEWMLSEGYARHEPTGEFKQEYQQAEQEAQREQRGIWTKKH